MKWTALASGLALVLGPAADAEPSTGVSIGVALFERVAPPGVVLPEFSSLLARRLATLGVDRVVGPEALGAAVGAEPDATEVQSWAAQAEVGILVVGRLTQIGDQLSLDVRLRSGASGEVTGTYVAEIQSPDRVEPAIEGLAKEIVEAVVALQQSRESTASRPPISGRDRFGLRGFAKDAPLTILSDSLDAFQEGGRRRLVFAKHVRVTQADLTVTADRLEAIYPENSSQPDRLVAEGRVVVTRGTQEARCDRAIYWRTQARLVCRGSAELRDGDDLLRGEQIEFNLDLEHVAVTGGASVVNQPDAGATDAEPPRAAGVEP